MRKNHSGFLPNLPIFKSIGLFLLANAGGAYAASKYFDSKMKEHENQNNQMMTVALGKQTVDIKPETNNAYITCLSGRTTINVPKPDHELTSIEILSVIGEVTINVEPGVRVNVERSNHFEVYVNKLSECEDEDAPVVNVNIKDLATRFALLDKE